MSDSSESEFTKVTAKLLRDAIRARRHEGPTAGLAQGHAQANLVILPQSYAEEFAEFCRLNPQSCPLIARTEPGDPCPRDVASDADLRSDVPRYRVFHHGKPESTDRADIVDLWRDDFVAFLLGCSFTFEGALESAGLRVRHIEQNRNVPMFRTSRACQSAGRFAGPLVVSMRPYRPEVIERVAKVTADYPRMHGAPVHFGDPAAIGIADLMRPDFGDAVRIDEGEIPVFWACGVTPQLALAAARPEIAITHSPGCMFVMDRTDASFYSPQQAFTR